MRSHPSSNTLLFKSIDLFTQNKVAFACQTATTVSVANLVTRDVVADDATAVSTTYRAAAAPTNLTSRGVTWPAIHILQPITLGEALTTHCSICLLEPVGLLRPSYYLPVAGSEQQEPARLWLS
jgi:hypothetical protein